MERPGGEKYFAVRISWKCADGSTLRPGYQAQMVKGYATMDAWAKFPDMADRYARYVQKRIANDRCLIGWYGESAAADTNLATYPH